MRKRISLKTRRPDLSRHQFRDYYENHHVPLGLSFIDQFGWRRYVRNHVLEARGHLVGFDCYAEFWVDDDSDDEALYRFLRSPDFRKLDQDDRQFLDISRRLSFEVRETVLKGRPSQIAGTQKWALIWRSDSSPRQDAGTVANRITTELGERLACAVLDNAVQAPAPDAPFDTILTLYMRAGELPAFSDEQLPLARWSLLTLDPVETPSEKLLGASAR